ncbi:restriction endonuclease subunit S [Bilophila wadsworthia]|uniref:restriction endonuclease subunit S n=1 Tax=Bilophila wadsworthia TaxID=35833 RepID=UPI0024321619|nr:restriction endonuclease subunit S [Bilophila wadsworthia]
MSRIDDLIAKLCPNGVEYKALGSIARIKNGKDHKSLSEGDIPVYGSGGVMRYVDSYVYDKPSVLIPRKGSLGNLFYVDVPFWNVDTIFYTEINELLIYPKFLYYFLTTVGLGEMNSAGGVPSQTQSVLNKIQIPVPSLETQREIVKVLDTFTKLEAELEAELEARRRQYHYYRDQLLNFEGRDDVQWMTLGEVATIGTGSRNTNEAIPEGKYPFFVRSQQPLRIDEFEFDEISIITAGDGVGVGKVFHFVNGKYALHQRAYRIHITSSYLNPKFIFYFIRNNFARYLATTSVHASVTSLRKPMFEKYPIPVPSLEEQTRIVAILDKFDALVNDLSSGLPAEIAARRKQYEYYRDRLLTFKEAQ